MTRQQSNFIRHATGEQLLLLTIFEGNRLQRVIDRELDLRAAERWARGYSQMTTHRDITGRAA